MGENIDISAQATDAEEIRADIKTRFQPGNKFWLARSSSGTTPIFSSPEHLWEMCCEYFEWVNDNPLYEHKAFSFQGESWVDVIPKQRVMTLSALCRFLAIDDKTWRNYRVMPDFILICSLVEQTIRDQKFEGASAGLFNPMIIARDLGLRENTAIDHTSSDKSMTPQITAVNSVDAAAQYQDIIADE